MSRSTGESTQHTILYTSNLNEFLNNIKITKCFGLNEIKSDICLIEFLIVFQESVILFKYFPTSVRSMYSKCHLG